MSVKFPKVTYQLVTVLTLILCLIGLVIYQYKMHSRLDAVKTQSKQGCQVIPDAELVAIYREQSRFINDQTPTVEAAKETQKLLNLACAELNSSAPWWVTEDHIAHSQKLGNTVSDHQSKLEAQIADARTYAEYTYSTWKYRFSGRVLRLSNRTFEGPIFDPLNQPATLKQARELPVLEATSAVDAGTLREHIAVYDAAIKEVLEAGYAKGYDEFMKTELGLLENFPTPKETRPHYGPFPPGNPTKLFDVNATDADINNRFPKSVCGQKWFNNGTRPGHPEFAYELRNLEGTFYIQEVDAILDDTTRDKKIQTELFPFSYMGNGNMLCADTAIGEQCWEQSQDGRYWHVLFNDTPSNACRNGALDEFLSKLEESK